MGSNTSWPQGGTVLEASTSTAAVAAPVTALKASARGRRRRFNRDRFASILLLVPSLGAIGVFVYGFIGWTFWAALTNWNNIAPFTQACIPGGICLLPRVDFVGLQTFSRLLENPRFQIDVQNNVTFTVLFVVACNVIGLLLAILLDRNMPGESFFRVVFLMPMAISLIVTGVVWRWLENPSTGLNLILGALHLDFLQNGWYTDPSVGIKAVVIAATWQMSGFVMALYLAGLRGISNDLREAARVDGASEWQVFRHILLPLLAPITVTAIIILGHISLKIFDLTSAMTGPGPAFADDVPALFMYNTTFQGNHFAQGAGIATVLLLIVGTLVIPYLIYSLRTETER
jgi:glucose/mannose transport system permease protein